VPSAAAHLIPYALLGALSPLGVAATLAVMRTGRLKALGFGVGVVLGQLLACVVLVTLGAVVTPDRTKAYPTFDGLLQLGLGLVLLCLAVATQRRPATRRRPSSGRSQAALDRLQHVHFMTASAAGILLGIGGPKRLILTGLASASITASGITGPDEAILIGWYVLLATLLVWIPVLAYLLLGDWVVDGLDAALKWLARHRRPATVVALAVIGTALVVSGLILL
jgi:hypothetical protein